MLPDAGATIDCAPGGCRRRAAGWRGGERPNPWPGSRGKAANTPPALLTRIPDVPISIGAGQGRVNFRLLAHVDGESQALHLGSAAAAPVSGSRFQIDHRVPEGSQTLGHLRPMPEPPPVTTAT